jgi:hypothetical protein
MAQTLIETVRTYYTRSTQLWETTSCGWHNPPRAGFRRCALAGTGWNGAPRIWWRMFLLILFGLIRLFHGYDPSLCADRAQSGRFSIWSFASSNRWLNGDNLTARSAEPLRKCSFASISSPCVSRSRWWHCNISYLNSEYFLLHLLQVDISSAFPAFLR